MATIEKLIKAFEALKVFHPQGTSTEESSKKKDVVVTKKDKILNCNIVADCICATNMRAITDFPKFLGIAMETFLGLCDDAESDVRMVGDECINRSIKVLLETNLGRLQVELYKEIKKNGASRSLRAAVWRFADMAHLIRPQKSRPYIVNLLPCLARICKREDEAIQETLSIAMQKICPPLMSFATESEVKALLKAFLPNLRSNLASCRRNAASSLVLICRYSRSPGSFFKYLLGILVDYVIPVDGDQPQYLLLGILLCLRTLIPHLSDPANQDHGMKGSFGNTTKDKEDTGNKEQLIKVLQILVFMMNHKDHNVVNAALEVCQQLFKHPTPVLLSILNTKGSIKKTTVYKVDVLSQTTDLGINAVPSMSKLEDDITVDDDTDISESLADELADQSHLMSDLENVLPDKILDEDDGKTQKSENVKIDSDSNQVVFTTSDTEYSGLTIGDLNDDKSEKSNLSQMRTGSQETLDSVQSLSPTHQTLPQLNVTQDMNGNPEIELEISPEQPEISSKDTEILLDHIGALTDDEKPIVYFARYICRKFLLAGQKGEIITDRKVRVSIKSLALGCISCILNILPEIFFHNVFKDVDTEHYQLIQDVMIYASHLDPQLKGNVTLLIGNFVRSALKAAKGNFNKWTVILGYDVKALTISTLLETILGVLDDSSSVAVRLALSALQLCIHDLLLSVDSNIGLQALLKLLEIRENPYWLVKVEILDLIGSINFRVVTHLESCCDDVQKGDNHYLGKLNLQKRVVSDIIMAYFGSDDTRVRHNAAQTLVKLIPNLFFPVDHSQHDPIITESRFQVEGLMCHVTRDSSLDLPPLVLGLVKPYHVINHVPVQSDVESNLSRVVMNLLHILNMSDSKQLTYGCCHALCLLSETYPATVYCHSWCCGPPTPLVPKDSTAKQTSKRPPSRSLSSSSTHSIDEMTTGSGGGLLTIVLSLLTSHMVSLDIKAHSDALKLAGNLVAGATYKSLKVIDDSHHTEEHPETKWAAISDRVLVPLIDQLFTHIARLLNIFTHVIEENVPGPPQMKPTLPSLPNAPSLSPIKRKSKAENSPGGTTTTPDKSTPQKQPKEKEKEPEKDKNKKDAIGLFYNTPHYMKLYEVFKGAYSNYQRSLDLSSTDKFCTILKTALDVLSQILEISTISDIGKSTEEFLGYLRVTVSLEPTVSILCVQQMLKGLFGTNIVSQWEPQKLPNISHKPGKASRLTGNVKPGLYHYCFTQPYAHFTQSLAGATFKATSQAEPEDSLSSLNWIRKCVERKIPAILKPSSKTDKSAIAAYIRLFEPLVIKALKQYTVTSVVPLQRQVLDLLSQLIQLRVNYCLLDSDQVFIGFIIKQFEFIEEGQIRDSEDLIPNIFNFLVMLSYEKFHSKSVIMMPKIIQLCDGIMASGLDPVTHAIPALKPIVYDLFLLRGVNKADISKDLETQREVIVSMLLRLIQYYQTLDILVIVLQQSHKESEERWKRLSRQITDVILPSLARQQINMDNAASLDVLHRLFESLAPIVFRPVDILLKTLLQTPDTLGSVESLQRWLCMVLSLLRVLMAHSKEEVILTRMQELKLKLTVFKVTASELSEEERLLVLAFTPEETIAWFLIQIIGRCVDAINRNHGITGMESCDFLMIQLSQLLLYITHMFQSGMFRKVATCSMQISSQESPECLYNIKQLNQYFLSFSMTSPTLTLQWCNILILLNFDDQILWSDVMQTPKRYLKPGMSQSLNLDNQLSTLTQCCNLEILRQGGLVLFCDYVCENLSDAEQLTWLVINHVGDLIELVQESPVLDFVSAIHRNPAASSLFIQAIHARCGNVTRPSVIKRTLKCLEAIHLSQTGALITLLIDKFLNTHHLAVSRICDTISCRRVELLLADNVEEARMQLPLEDLDKLFRFMETHSLTKRHARLLSLLKKFRCKISPDDNVSFSTDRPHPITLPDKVTDIQPNKECFISVVKEQCYRPDCDTRECAHLLKQLDYADILSITMTKEFSLSILRECLYLGAYQTMMKDNETVVVLDNEGNRVLLEPEFDPLFQAAQLTLNRHFNNIVNLLPIPHQVLTFEKAVLRQSRYEEKLEDILTDSSWIEMIFSLTNSLTVYLQALSTFPWQPEVPSESVCDICRFCVLSAEVIDWMLHHNQLPTSEQLSSCLHCVSLVLQSLQLSQQIDKQVTWLCSLVSMVYQVVLSYEVLPGEKLIKSPAHDTSEDQDTEQSDLQQIIKACDRVSDLIICLHTRLKGPSNLLPSFVADHIKNIILGLSRQSVINSYARVPGIVWKIGWTPTPTGEPRTQLPPLPLDLLQDKDVLKEFVFRINTFGWISRQQFEETWMSLLPILNPVRVDEETEEINSPEEEVERSQCMVIAVKCVTSMLLHSTLTPVPGNPSNSRFEMRPRDKPLGFLHTRCGKKLTTIRGVIEQEVQNLYNRSNSRQLYYNGGKDDNKLLRYMFDSNLERELGVENFNLGQISVEGIWSVVGALSTRIVESDASESPDSPPESVQTSQQQFPLITIEKRERSMTFSSIDINSCLQFLLDLYGQWLSSSASPKPPLMLRNEVIKSVVCLSDVYVERDQYDWMLNILLETQKIHPAEDEMINQYINVGLCKAAAVVGVDSSVASKIMTILDYGLKTPHLPSRISALHGILYLLEAGIQETTKQIIPLATDFLLKNLSSVNQTCITSQTYVLTMWATAFYIMENYHVDLKDLEFPSKILQFAVTTASGNEESVSTAVYLAILKGLERLLLTDVLSQQDSEVIMKLGVDRLCLPSPQRSLAALGLVFTCMYSGKQYDQYSPVPRDTSKKTSAYNFDVVYQDPESLILAMERVTVLFDRIKKGYPYEARVITRVLPTFLADFFPPQDIMNKVIGEFISSQQPYPKLVAQVVFQVFSNLHDQEQTLLVQDWVMLSLSNFTQRTPISLAVWSLTCFFISASTNRWLRSLFPHVVNRMGKMEVVDTRLFCVSAMSFYNQLTDDAQLRAFLSTFQMVISLGAPYTQLLELLSDSKK
ncbi:huntingtin-like [Mytilus californianus]|uniref:huntingtin-like n=1 Tax=Mytilus californianus TaxID=6549 RepID=UPI00224762C9|nr:huntingtin-like [Mytilus californianus]